MSGPVPGTPTPWFSVPYGDGDNLVICSDQQGEWRICFMATPGSSSAAWQDIQANAAAIVHRMNNWDAEQAKIAALVEAVLAVVNATRAYLPPDGIDAKECISRILEATDNPTINPIILEAENGHN